MAKIDRLLQKSTMDPRILKAIEKVISDLRVRNRHRTMYEKALVIILKNDGTVSNKQLEKIFKKVAHPRQAVTNLLSRLDKKLIAIDPDVHLENVNLYRLNIRTVKK